MLRDTIPAPAPETIRVSLPSPTTQSSGLTFTDHLWLGVYAALASFVFAIVGKALGYMINRNHRHHTALVRLEYGFTHIRLRLDQSLKVITWVHDALKAEGKEKVTLLPETFEVDNSPCLDLYNKDLVSKVLVVNAFLDAMNKTMISWREHYAELWDGSLKGVINVATYRANAKHMAGGYLELAEEFRTVRPKIDEILGTLRVLGEKDRPYLLGVLGSRLKSGPVSDAELKEAIAEIQRERDVSAPPVQTGQ